METCFFNIFNWLYWKWRHFEGLKSKNSLIVTKFGRKVRLAKIKEACVLVFRSEAQKRRARARN